MIHFLNTNIPNNKNIEISLSHIYGIGRKEANKICKKLGFNPKTLFKNLNNQSRSSLSNFIEFNYVYGFHLKRLKKQNINMLIKLRTYRGNRHYFGYLVRGQRSKNKKLRRHI
jgi:small subunit ribosomal protein S13